MNIARIAIGILIGMIVGIFLGSWVLNDHATRTAKQYKKAFPSRQVTVTDLDPTVIYNLLKEARGHSKMVFNLHSVTVASPENTTTEYMIYAKCGTYLIHGTIDTDGKWRNGSYQLESSTMSERYFTDVSLKIDPNIDEDLRQVLLKLPEKIIQLKPLKSVTL